MAERYSLDIAGFVATAGDVASSLDALAGAVNGAIADLDGVSGLLAAEPDLAHALSAATDDRRRTGPGAVARGGEVLDAAGKVAQAYLEADQTMAATTDGAAAGIPDPAGIPSPAGASRREAVAR